MKVSLELQPCLKPKSGIGIYAYEISESLQKIKGLELKGDIFNFINKSDVSGYIEGLNFDKDVCKFFSYGLYRRVWNYIPIKYNNLFKENADIYHFFDYIVPPRIQGKVITTVHDMTYELYPGTMQQKTFNRIKSGIEYSVNRADKIVTISESTKKDIIKILNVPSSKIDIVPPGVNFSIFNYNYSEEQINRVKNKYNLPNKYILYMGTLEPRKNIESIVEAFNLFKKESDFSSKNIKLVIAGKKGWMYDSVFFKVKKLSLENEVLFTDYVDEKDKPIIYKLASLFVFPSLYEGFGIPILEAMAASVPVITSNVSSLPEVAGNAAILVSPKDVVAIAEGMNKILTDINIKKELINKGNLQSKRFSWDDSAKKLYEIYNFLK